MKSILICTLMLLTTGAYAADNYKFDPMHTYVEYNISHIGYTFQTGKWFAEGNLILDQDKPQNSKVDVTIQIASINTGLPELDKHLKSALFFDVIRFPIATFVSTKIVMKRKTRAEIQGMLTVHGISHPVTLEAELNKSGVSEITNKMTAGFTAHTKIKRSNFGITTLLPELSDDVDITINAEAVKSE